MMRFKFVELNLDGIRTQHIITIITKREERKNEKKNKQIQTNDDDF